MSVPIAVIRRIVERISNMEPRRNWIFTFGANHQFPGKYVKIFGTYESARDEMFKMFGDRWAFQYPEETWEEMKNNPKRIWSMEEELSEELWQGFRGDNQEEPIESE